MLDEVRAKEKPRLHTPPSDSDQEFSVAESSNSNSNYLTSEIIIRWGAIKTVL